MHISTKTEYAVRGLTELALLQNQRPVSILEICTRQNLPRKYMEQLFAKLKRAELITSVQGAHGGYLLQRATHDITLNDIMWAVEDNISQTNCETDYQQREYCIGLPCGFHKLWNEIETHLEEYFSSINLDDIIKKNSNENIRRS
ncbi:MAG: Rrf2 family transcriptional regulator [Candidatus Cloacimonadales bacterium]